MEDAHYGSDDEMDEDEEEEDDDVEMDYGDETGSEDTSASDEDEDDLEADLEDGTGDSEDGWHNHVDDEGEDLVENEGIHDEDGGDEDEDEDEDDGDEEVMWQDVRVGEDAADEGGEDVDDEHNGTIPIMTADLEEEGDISEADEFDDLGILDLAQEPPAAAGVFVGEAEPFNMFGDGFTDANARDAPQLFWQGSMRNSRRREDGLENLFGLGRARQTPTGPTPEAAVHPLLLDPSSAAGRAANGSRTARRIHRGAISGIPQGLLQSLENAIGGGPAGTLNLFHQLIAQGRNGGETIRIDLPHANLLPPFMHRHGRHGISASIRVERAPRSGDRHDHRNFEPLVTLQRWAEEVKTLYGKFEQDRLTKLGKHVVLALMPAAIEAVKQAKEEEEKEAQKRRELEAKAAAEAQAAQEAEEAERVKQEALKAEEAARAAEEAARLALETAVPEAEEQSPDADAEMGDVQGESLSAAETAEPGSSTAVEVSSDVQQAPAEAGPSTEPQRVTVMIHGNPVDITDTGIDPEFLEALPDDMREEVLNQHVRDQRAARVERPADSHISPEFLDALPPELRAEIIQQESIERARLAQSAAAPARSNPTAPADIDPASFIASLDPQLRQVILMDSEDSLIQTLPSHMIAEAGLYRETRLNQTPPTNPPSRPAPSQLPQSQKGVATREAIQLLDKPAIAVLVRLLFFPEVLRKNLLLKVLVNLCENSRTRTDIFNLLLNILQDGTGDLVAIDRSFAQLSFRNSRGHNPTTPKSAGKQRMGSDYFALPNVHVQNEIVPELIAQRCIDALTYVVGSNELSSVFFLTEHELPAGLRRTHSKKGKGKEKQAPQTHYPIVLLLSLLGRASLLKTPSLIESVVQLLALVTRPLVSLHIAKLAKAQDAEKQASGSGSQPTEPTEPSADSDPQAAPPPQAEPTVVTPPAGMRVTAGIAAVLVPVDPNS
ncbi:hypothetical protein QCA50_009606 [Cerrena zonata]|uniref:Uncharacterized protein n=1 Tax=Cerrena zonata TaxID=2478898 RepID=A0AAW0G0V9_9APHY